jgi:hypothetical protein
MLIHRCPIALLLFLVLAAYTVGLVKNSTYYHVEIRGLQVYDHHEKLFVS